MVTMNAQPLPQSTGSRSLAVRRWLAPAAMLALVALGFALGLHRDLSLSALAEHRAELKTAVADHLALALLAFTAAYAAVVALSIPCAAAMSIGGGFLFGWALSVPATVVAAVTGATIVFQIVKTSFGEALAARAGPLVARLSRGFAENGFSVLLFLRLTPVFPFWAVNAVAGLCRLPLRTFIAATAIGIVPASIAFALVGAGLDRVIDQQLAARGAGAASGPAHCPRRLDPATLISPELGLGFAALGLVALLPLGLGFAGGAMTFVALFELIPEAVAAAGGPATAAVTILSGSAMWWLQIALEH
jgi:uncharacterized membrane protein YdjX (TVP38/TMEM64 family)